MTEVAIRNKNIIKTLDSLIEDFYNIYEGLDVKDMLYSSDAARQNPEYFCSDEYLHELLNRPGDDYLNKHEGFPEEHAGVPMQTLKKKYPGVLDEIVERAKYEFAMEIGAHTNALTQYYPPGGFVGWHTNWNANAYQILFTWSKDGNGYFRYWDALKKEIVTVQDKPGWQCRWYYFGRKDEPDHHCWHSAYAGSDRFTFAYKFVNKSKDHEWDAQAQAARDELVAELERE